MYAMQPDVCQSEVSSGLFDDMRRITYSESQCIEKTCKALAYIKHTWTQNFSMSPAFISMKNETRGLWGGGTSNNDYKAAISRVSRDQGPCALYDTLRYHRIACEIYLQIQEARPCAYGRRRPTNSRGETLHLRPAAAARLNNVSARRLDGWRINRLILV